MESSTAADFLESAAATSSAGTSGASDKKFEIKEIELDTTNAVYLNCMNYAALVKTDDLFCDEKRDALSKGGSYPVFGTDGLLMVPSSVVRPSFAMPNTLFHQPFMGAYLDKPLPMTAVWVGGGRIKEVVGWIYDDPDAYDNMLKCASSVSKHTGLEFPTDPVWKTTTGECTARLIQRDLSQGVHPDDYEVLGADARSDDDDDEEEEEEDGDEGPKAKKRKTEARSKGPWYGTDIVPSECSVVIYTNAVNTLYMLANEDRYVRYTHYTPATSIGENVVGGRAEILGMFSRRKEVGGEAKDGSYTPPSLGKMLRVKNKKKRLFILECGAGATSEIGRILRQMYRFGPGDSGGRTKAMEAREDHTCTDFEKRLFKWLKGSDTEGSEAMALYAGSTVLKSLMYTMTPNEYKYDLDCTEEAAWTFMVGFAVGQFTAANTAWLGTEDTKKGPVITYGMLSKNPLFNLQTTVTKSSKGFCGLIQYLVTRLRATRYPGNCRPALQERGAACEKCASPLCAAVWTDSYLNSSYLTSPLTAEPKTSQMPSSKYLTIVAAPEYNTGASSMGTLTVSTEGSTKRKDIGEMMCDAHHKVTSNISTELNVSSEKSKVVILKKLAEVIGKIKTEVSRETHNVRVPYQHTINARKFESVFTVNCGGMPNQYCLGMLSVMYVKSSVVTTMARFVQACGVSLDMFGKDTSNQREKLNGLITSCKLGLYLNSDVKAKSFSINNLNLSPLKDVDKGVVYTFNNGYTTGVWDKPGVCYNKATGKIKSLLGTLEAGKNNYTGNKASNEQQAIMSVNTHRESAGVVSGASAKQMEEIKKSMRAVGKSIAPGITDITASTHYDKFQKQLLNGPLSIFRHNELIFSTVREMVDLYAQASMFRFYGYRARASEYYDGISIPKFVKVVGAGHPSLPQGTPPDRASDLKPFSHELVTAKGPALMVMSVHTGSFEATVEGKKSSFQTINMVDFSMSRLTKVFSGDSVRHLMTRSHLSMYIPVKVSGMGPSSAAEKDRLVDAVTNMFLECKTISSKCNAFKALAELLLTEIKRDKGLSESTDAEVPYTLEEVKVKFDDLYDGSSTMFTASPLLAEAAMLLNRQEDLEDLCKRAENCSEDIEEEEEENEMDIDFTDVLSGNRHMEEEEESGVTFNGGEEEDDEARKRLNDEMMSYD